MILSDEPYKPLGTPPALIRSNVSTISRDLNPSQSASTTKSSELLALSLANSILVVMYSTSLFAIVPPVPRRRLPGSAKGCCANMLRRLQAYPVYFQRRLHEVINAPCQRDAAPTQALCAANVERAPPEIQGSQFDGCRQRVDVPWRDLTYAGDEDVTPHVPESIIPINSQTRA